MKLFENLFKSARRNRNRKLLQKAHHNHSSRIEYMITGEDVTFEVAEAFRNLKAALTVSMPRKQSHQGVAVMMTSACPEDGKTTVTVNLALMLAMSEAKVILIDADVRKGRVAKYFNQKSAPGLADYLSGLASLEDVTRSSKESENLSYISCGTHSPRPYELLESDEMKNLLQELKQKYDYIIIDTPPLLLVSDALAIVPGVDGAVLVCRHEVTYVSDIARSLDKLEFAKAKVLGVVVNDFKAREKMTSAKYDRYKYYNYTYSSEEPKV